MSAVTFLVLPNVFLKANNGLQNPTSNYLSLNMLRTIDVMKNIAHEYSSFSLGVSIFLPSFIMKLGFKTTIYYYYNIHTFFSKHHKNSPIKWPPLSKNAPYMMPPPYIHSLCHKQEIKKKLNVITNRFLPHSGGTETKVKEIVSDIPHNGELKEQRVSNNEQRTFCGQL